MKPRAIWITLAALVAILVVGVYVVVGGGGDDGSVPGPISDGLARAGVVNSACAGSSGTSPAEPTGVTAVLVDRTASTRGTDGAPDYAAALDAEVLAAVQRGDAVVVSGFDGTAATVRWTLVRTAFQGDANRQLLARSGALRCLRDELAVAARGDAVEPGTDVLGALQAAEGLLAAAPAGRRRLLVATDGLATVGCADLNTVSVGGDAARVVDRCRNTDQIPELTGATVAMLGLGSPGPDQPRPESEQLKWLGRMWAQMCAASTGDESGCDVAGGISATTAKPRSPESVDDPSVRWPEVTRTDSAGVVTVSLPEGLLFDTDSSTLRLGALEFLAAVADTVQEVSGTILEIVGHTDGRGEPARNDLLSLARAQEVAGGLSSGYGLTAGSVRGAGENEPACTPETRPDGSQDSAALQCNRRVEVVIKIEGQSR